MLGLTHAKCQFGIKGSLLFSNISNSNNIETNSEFGYSLGAFKDFEIGNTFRLRPEVRVITKGYSFEIPQLQNDLRVNYLEIPVDLIYNPFSEDFSNLYFLFAPYFSVGINGSYEGIRSLNSSETEDITGDITFRNESTNEDVTSEIVVLRQFDAGIIVGSGIKLHNYLIEITWSRGLRSIWPPFENSDFEKEDKAYNTSLQLCFGYIFGKVDF